MPDAKFADPRLAELYDVLDPDRSDLDAYAAIAAEIDAQRTTDLGCGTGTFALLLSARGLSVTGIDPAAASLQVARRKPGAARVRWIEGTSALLEPDSADLVTMTGNVAQVFLSDSDWVANLEAIHQTLVEGGHVVFETRTPEARAWEQWTPAASKKTTMIEGVGPVESWVTVVDASPPLISFQWTYRFVDTNEVLVSDSTLRFRTSAAVSSSLNDCGFVVEDLREAPDRPGKELVFIARKT